MISTALEQLIDDIYRQLNIAIEVHQDCDLYKSMEGRHHGDGIAVNRFSVNRASYDDFIINLYINREYFYGKILEGVRGNVSQTAYEILTYQTIMGWPIYLADGKGGQHPPYKIFITMKGEK